MIQSWFLIFFPFNLWTDYEPTMNYLFGNDIEITLIVGKKYIQKWSGEKIYKLGEYDFSRKPIKEKFSLRAEENWKYPHIFFTFSFVTFTCKMYKEQRFWRNLFQLRVFLRKFLAYKLFSSSISLFFLFSKDWVCILINWSNLKLGMNTKIEGKGRRLRIEGV